MGERSGTLRLVAIALALLGAGACLAFAWVSAWLPFGRSYTDGTRLLPDAPELHQRVVVHEAPERWLEELFADRGVHSRVALAPDGRVVVFAATGANGRMDLFWSERIGESWLSRGPLLALNQPAAHEIAPFFDAHGALYFASDRPGSRGFDLYVASWDGSAFRDLYRVSEESVNGPWDEVDPCYDERSGSLYFASNRPRREALDDSADFDLFRMAFRADGSSGDVERLEAICSPADERAPALHPSGGTLLFTSRRTGGIGGSDLYSASSAGPRVGFQQPELLSGDSNTAADELDPTYLDGGFAFAFRRQPAQGAAALGRAIAEPAGDSAGAVAPPEEFSPEAAELRGLWRVRSIELDRLPGPFRALDFVLIAAALALIALLIWLGKRWSALDIITKALIISLLIHILFLVLSRRVDIESEIPPPAPKESESLIDVAFVPQEDATMAMHGGAVERTLEEQVNSPDQRAELEVASAELAPEQPLEAPSAERESFEAELPERSAEAEREESAPATTVALEAPEAPAVKTETAPELPSAEPKAAEAEALASVSFENAPRTSAAAPRAAAKEAPAPAAPSSNIAAPERRATEIARAERRTSVLERSAVNTDAPAVKTNELAVPAAPASSAGANESASEVLAEGPRPVAPHGAREGLDAPARSAGATASSSSPALEPSDPRLAASAPVRSAAPSSAPIGRSATNAERTSESTAPAVAMRSPLEAMPLAPTGSGSAEPNGGAGDLLADLGAATGRAPASESSEPATNGASVSAPREGTSGPLPAAPARETGLAMQRSGHRATALTRPGTGPERAADVARSSSTASVRKPTAPGAPRAPNESAGDMLAGLEPAANGEASGRSCAPLGAALSDAPRALPGPIAAATRLGAPQPGPAPVIARGGAAGRPMTPSGAPGIAMQRGPAGIDRRFERRFGEQKTRAIDEGGGSVETEKAVQAGLRYLAEKQDGRGFWGDARYKHDKYIYTMYGKSGLALLAFLGAGHTQMSGTEFSPIVARSIQFLVRAQDARSGHFGNCDSYGHAIATYALCEAYALTKDAAMREPLQRAIDWIVENQNRQVPGSTEFGGWTYYYPDGREYDPYARASITAWQVMALESARIGGLDVSPAVLSAARQFLEGCFDPSHGWFRYNHQPSRLRSVYPTLPGSTPASLFALRLLGTAIDHRLYDGAWAYTLERRPKSYRRPRQDEFVNDAAGNLYFWYYGSLAFFQRGGDEWVAWNTALKDVLLPAQTIDGSWRPIEPYAETAGDTEESRIYTTAMCVLMLEVYYRYFTPLLSKR